MRQRTGFMSLLRRMVRAAIGKAKILSALILFQTAALFAQTEVAATSAPAYLSVYSLTEGLPVLMNGKAVGKTPLRRIAVAAGQYEIIVQAVPNASWLEEDWRAQVALLAGDSLRLIATMVKGYRINSIPEGAQVWRQGQLLGTTPFILRLPETQIAQLEVKRDFYQTVLIELGKSGIGASRERNYEVVLSRNFDYADLQPREAKQQNSRIAKYRKLTYLAATISAASGVGSALLKREADRAFEQYLVTGDPQQRENYFARAEKYDRYYSVAFATFEVGFAFSFYGFLKSIHK